MLNLYLMGVNLMQILGSTKVQVNNDVLKALLERVSGSSLDDLVIRLDSRANVKSSYGKFMELSSSSKEIRVYTGAIALTWDQVFKISDGLLSDLDVLLVTTLFLFKKYMRGQNYEIMVKNLHNIKVEADYVDIMEHFKDFKDFYVEKDSLTPKLNTSVVQQPKKEKSQVKQREEVPQVEDVELTFIENEDEDLL